MKIITSALGILLLGAGVSIGLGCKKEAPPPSPTVSGVVVDAPKLQAAFMTSTNADQREKLAKFQFGLRYGKYVDALMALDGLASDPSLTEQQKKVVNEVIEQVKQVANAQPAAPAQ